jgi:hypothetical protein
MQNAAPLAIGLSVAAGIFAEGPITYIRRAKMEHFKMF